MFDAAVNTLRPQLITIPGVAIPFPYGGKNRLISVDLDMQALQARGLAPADVVNAINVQNLILPSGTAKIGATEYTVRMNGSPEAIAGLNDLPVRTAGGNTTYLRDVAFVRDGFSPQTNIVRQDGAARRAAVGAEERRRVDARHRRQPARDAAARAGAAAARHQDHAAVRPVGVREGGGQGRGRRGGDRRRADRRDGAAVPRQLAQHA